MQKRKTLVHKVCEAPDFLSLSVHICDVLFRRCRHGYFKPPRFWCIQGHSIAEINIVKAVFRLVQLYLDLSINFRSSLFQALSSKGRTNKHVGCKRLVDSPL